MHYESKAVALAGSVGRIEVMFREMCPKCRAGIMMKFRFVACHLELQTKVLENSDAAWSITNDVILCSANQPNPQFQVEALFNGFLIKTYFIRRWCCLLFIRMHRLISFQGVKFRLWTTRRHVISRMLILCCRCLQDGRQIHHLLSVQLVPNSLTG